MHHLTRRLAPSRTGMPARARTAVMLAVAAAVLSTTLGLAASASASSGYVQILPRVAPSIDLAQGIGFPAIARDSSGVSYAETWKFEPASDGYVYIINRHWRDGTTQLALDVQDTVGNGPSDAGDASTVGLSPVDWSSTQQWKEQRVTFGGVYQHSVFINRYTGRKLTWNGTGFNPAYSQRQNPTGPLAEFNVKQLP
jgi:hypothetical protein